MLIQNIKSLAALSPSLQSLAALSLAFAGPLAFVGPAFAQPMTAAPTSSPAGAQTASRPGAFAILPTMPPAGLDAPPLEPGEGHISLGSDQGDRMTMPVRIGEGIYDFVIDTGSQRTIVSSEIAQRLALPALKPVEIVSMAGRVTVNSVQLGGLQFGDHVVGALEALSIAHSDLGSSGLIGLDSLKGKRLTLDFLGRRMEIGKSRRTAAQTEADTIVVQARSRYGQLILVDAKIDSKRVNVILDTGAELSIGNMALFNSLKLQRLVIPPQPTRLTSVTGVEVPAQFTIVRRMTIGPVTLSNVPMVFLDAAPFDELELSDKPAMLLGMGMLRMFDKVAIDFGNRHVDFQLKQGAVGAPGSSLASADAMGPGLR